LLEFSTQGVLFAGNFSGEWRIYWSNMTANNMNLNANNNSLVGSYINDSGKDCQVTGSLNGDLVSFVIRCQKWQVNCSGELASTGVVEGTFRMDDGTAGAFRMLR
jgi:hypothetical protein